MDSGFRRNDDMNSRTFRIWGMRGFERLALRQCALVDGRRLPVMADDGVAEQEVVFLRAGVDVVQDQWRAVVAAAVRHDADMQQAAAGEFPRHDVAGREIVR